MPTPQKGSGGSEMICYINVTLFDRTRDVEVKYLDITILREKIKEYGDSRMQGSRGDTNFRKSSARPH